VLSIKNINDLWTQKDQKAQRKGKTNSNKSFVRLSSFALLASGLFCFPASGKPVKAQKADFFADSVGVNVHLFFANTVYHQKYSSIIQPKLKELGIRHIRDNGVGDIHGYHSRLRELRRLGLRTTLISGYPGISPIQYHQIVKNLGNVVQAVEGPNEYNVYLNNPNWPSILRSYVQELHPLIKNDPATRHLPIIAPSLASWNEKDYKSVGDLSAYVDFGNMHSYYGGLHPTVYCGWCSTPKSYLDTYMDRARILSGSKQIMVTETGQHNAMNTTLNYILPASEDTAWKYISRQLLLNFNKGVKRSFLYELIDLFDNPQKDNVEYNYGLLRNDGSEKPAFIAVRDLVQFLKDTKTSFAPRTIDYELVGDTQDVHQTLLQKSNGNLYLILWKDVLSYDYSNKRSIDVPPAKAYLQLNTPISQANVYSLSPSIKKVSEYFGTQSLAVEIPDHPLIIELVPSAAKIKHKKHFPKLRLPSRRTQSLKQSRKKLKLQRNRQTRNHNFQ
jgi:hypothetical protein